MNILTAINGKQILQPVSEATFDLINGELVEIVEQQNVLNRINEIKEILTA